jgi:uncharacterized protein (TIGR03067 family)
MHALVIASLSVAFAPAPVYKEPKPPALLAAMQGEWEMKGRSDMPRNAPAKGPRIFVRIEQDRWVYVFRSGGGESEGTPTRITLGDRRGAVAIDLNLTTPDARNVLRGIVKVEGKRMTVRHCAGKGERPRGFGPAADEKNGTITYTFERAK